MSLILQPLPTSLDVDGIIIPIYTDFRAGIEFETILQESKSNEESYLERTLDLFFPSESLPLINECINEGLSDLFVQTLLDYYACGKTVFSKNDKQPKEKRKEKRVYSYMHDDELIYAAFLQIYGIDLTEVEMHWWKFKALFRSLPENCEFVKIMGYRCAEIKDYMSAEQKRALRELKKLHAIPDMRTEEEKENDFADAMAASFK